MPDTLQTSRLARQFRPMTLGEIVDRAVELYRSNFALLGGLGVLALFPCYSLLLGWLYFTYYQRSIWGSQDYFILASPLIVGVVLGLAFSYLVRGAQIYALAQRTAGEEVRILAALVHAVRRSGTLLLMGFSGFCLMLVGGIFYLVPLILVVLLYSLTFPVATLEDRPYFYSLSRAYQLLKGSTGKLLGLFFTFLLLTGLGWLNLYLLRIVLVYLAQHLVNLDLSWLNELPYGSLILLLLVLIVLHPLKSCAYTLVYFDSRIRNEGWDLWLRIAEVTKKPLER